MIIFCSCCVGINWIFDDLRTDTTANECMYNIVFLLAEALQHYSYHNFNIYVAYTLHTNAIYPVVVWTCVNATWFSFERTHSAQQSNSKRGLLLVASACSLVAAGTTVVCGLLPSSRTPLHSTTSTTTATAAAATVARGDGDGDGGDRHAFPAGRTFISVPPLQYDANPNPQADPATDGFTNKRWWERRKLVAGDGHISNSTPVSAAPLNFVGVGEELSTKEGGEEAEAMVEGVDAWAENAKTAGNQGRQDGGGPPLSSRRLGDGQPDRIPASALPTTGRRTAALEINPQGQTEREVDGNSTPVTHNLTPTGGEGQGDGGGEGEGICSPLEVVGLGDCPELIPDGAEGAVGSNAIIEKMLDAKAEMLRQVHNERESSGSLSKSVWYEGRVDIV